MITFADAIQVKHLGYQAIAATATGGLNVLGFAILPIGVAFIIQSFVAQPPSPAWSSRGWCSPRRRFWS